MKRIIVPIVIITLLSLTPLTAASSYFVAETKADLGDVEYITTDAGHTGLIVTEDGIALEQTSNDIGLAPSGRYWFGSHDNPTETFAFSFSHHVEENPQITVRFDGVTVLDNLVDNIVFTVFDARGRFIGHVSENERQVTFTGGPKGSTYYVVIMINTHDVSPEEDINGIFSVTL